MFLNPLRSTIGALAALAVVLAGASSARAGTEVLIQELDGSNAVLSSQTFTVNTLPGVPNTFGSFRDVKVTVGSSSGASSNVNSLTTTVNAKPSLEFNATHQLRIIVTDDGFLNASPGGTAALTNDPGASSGIVGGVNQLTGNTDVRTGLIGSLTTIGTSGDSTETSPGGSAAQTNANIANLPGAFALTQTITIRAIETTGIDPNSTFGGTLSSTIVTTPPPPPNNPVPAPAGLVLALTVLPVVGLRRVFRRKPTA